MLFIVKSFTRVGGWGANIRTFPEENILYFYDGLCEPIYSGNFSSKAICKAFSRSNLKQPPFLTPPNSELQGSRSKMGHTRQRQVCSGSLGFQDSEALHSLFEPPSYLCSYFHDTTIRISHIFMNRFSEE